MERKNSSYNGQWNTERPFPNGFFTKAEGSRYHRILLQFYGSGARHIEKGMIDKYQISSERIKMASSLVPIFMETNYQFCGDKFFCSGLECS